MYKPWACYFRKVNKGPDLSKTATQDKTVGISYNRHLF
jgi:hypothetical protein